VILLTGQAKKTDRLLHGRAKQLIKAVYLYFACYPDDFEYAQFKNLLINGIHWALKLNPI